MKLSVVKLKSLSQSAANTLTAQQIAVMPHDTPVDPYTGIWFAAVDKDSECYGFACLKICKGTTHGYLARAGVLPEARGQGLQLRLIRAREREARRLGLTHMVCDTSRTNYQSSNSLIHAGYKLYEPKHKWAFEDGNYWIKRLT